jgi:hypothetical protein
MTGGAWGVVVAGIGLLAQEGTPAPAPAASDAQVEVRRAAPTVTYEPTAPVRVQFRNDFAKSFRVTEMYVLLDGEEIAQMKAGNDGELDAQFPIYEGELPAGLHALTVRAVLVGRNRGLFSYMDEYRVNVTSSHPFTPSAGRGGVLTVVLERRKGMTVPLERQPLLRFEADAALGGGGAPPRPQPTAAR